MEDDTCYAGTLEAIIWQIKNGNVFTFIDEVWHMRIFDWIAPNVHYRFCIWAYGVDRDENKLESDQKGE